MFAKLIHELDDEVLKLRALLKGMYSENDPPNEMTVRLAHILRLVRDMQEIIHSSHNSSPSNPESERFFDHHIR